MLNYEIVSNLTIKKVNNEQFVFDRNTGVVHTFNETGEFLWEKIMTKTPFIDIVQALVHEYGVSEEACKKDVFDFILELSNKKLLLIQD